MAFLATNLVPATEYKRAKELCVQIKRLAQTRSTAFASGATSAEILAVADNCNVYRNLLNDIKTVPGILDYAIEQENDPLYDVATEFNSVITALENIITEIVTTLPSDASDWLLINKINADGTLSPRDFTAAQVAAVKSLLDALDASIS